MPVRVACAGRRDRDARPDGVHEGLRRRRPGAVVSHLEQVDVRQSGCQQGRVDVLLDVAGQQEPAPVDLPQQHDRDVVDAGPAVGRRARHPTAHGPQHAQVDLVDREPVAGGQGAVARSARPPESIRPGGVPGSRADHPGLEHPPDPVSLQQLGKAGHVILVRVRQDQYVDPAIPWRDPPVQGDEQTPGVGAAIDQQAAAA
jgi:hypothetical protein